MSTPLAVLGLELERLWAFEKAKGYGISHMILTWKDTAIGHPWLVDLGGWGYHHPCLPDECRQRVDPFVR